jgi:hypothetical protein
VPTATVEHRKIANLDKWINGIVYRWVHGNRMNEFVWVRPGASTKYFMPDVVKDMVQVAHSVVAEIKQRVPEQANNQAYIKASIRFALNKFETRDLRNRHTTDNTIDETVPTDFEAPDPFKQMEAAHDVERIMMAANLSDVESLVIELKYGFGRGEFTGPLETYTSSKICGKSVSWVRDRLYMAHTKMQLAVEK